MDMEDNKNKIDMEDQKNIIDSDNQKETIDAMDQQDKKLTDNQKETIDSADQQDKKVTDNQKETIDATNQQDKKVTDNQKEIIDATEQQDEKVTDNQKEKSDAKDQQDKKQSNTKASVKKVITADEILQVSLKLFSEKGYFNTSLTEIKEALEITTTAGIYKHFKNKQAIAEALYGNILDSLSISIDDIRRRNRKASEQLREIVDLLFKLTDTAPEVIQFLFFVNIKEISSEETSLMKTPAFNKIIRVIQNGMKDGEIRSIDSMVAYTYFFGIIRHTLSLVLSGDLHKTAESYHLLAWTTAWASIAKK